MYRTKLKRSCFALGGSKCSSGIRFFLCAYWLYQLAVALKAQTILRRFLQTNLIQAKIRPPFNFLRRASMEVDTFRQIK